MEKKTRTPRTFESILNGASALPLKDRVQLVKIISEKNRAEVDKLTQDAKEAAELVR